MNCLPETRPLEPGPEDTVQKAFPSVSVRTPPVTDHCALAAHEYWHERTNGVWSAFFAERTAVTGLSGVLLHLKPLPRSPSVVWSGMDGTPADCKSGSGSGAEVSICFLHPLMRIVVDFEVTYLSPTRLQVRVLNEDRETRKMGQRLVPRDDQEWQQWEHDRPLLAKHLKGTHREVGVITLADILDGRACADAARLARISESVWKSSLASCDVASDKACLFSHVRESQQRWGKI